MEQQVIKLENPRSQKYEVTYPFPDGVRTMTYTWYGCKLDKRDIVSVPMEVYEYLKYRTNAFQNGKLIVAKEESDEAIKNEFEQITEDVKIYTHAEVVGRLEGNITKLKKEITKESDRRIIEQFVEVAREIKLDSSSKKKYLADLMKVDDVDYLFPEEN